MESAHRVRQTDERDGHLDRATASPERGGLDRVVLHGVGIEVYAQTGFRRREHLTVSPRHQTPEDTVQ